MLKKVMYLFNLWWGSDKFPFYSVMPLGGQGQEKLDKILHTNDVVSMCLLSIEFNSELLFVAGCLTWLHSVTHFKYAVGPTLFPHWMWTAND